MQTKALVLTGYGINCEQETKNAIEKVGGSAKIVHINELLENKTLLEEYNFFVFPGGFSFGDDIGSGKVLANKMKFRMKDELLSFIKNGGLILGICNGFQVLVKLGLLPVPDFNQRVTLTVNESGKFEDRWVWLKANSASPCIFTRGLQYTTLPVRHGEGRFLVKNEEELKRIKEKNLYVLQYVDRRGQLAGYPWNPNGSIMNIAGICDETGRIFGLMPHPEAFREVYNCPYWKNMNVKEAHGLKIFKNAVDYLREQ
jgi:phosphoribosylformylglycinamidine synthase